MGLYGGGSAPAPDPRIGQAAIMSAQLGGEYLDFMRDQSHISNAWADQDRTRYKSVFEPLQDEFIADAKDYASAERQGQTARQAISDVRQQAEISKEANERSLARMGVDPRSGRYAETTRAADTATALASAGAANTARRQVQAEGRGLMADAVNLGSGFAVNPATSLGLSNGSMSSGFNGAMRGQQQMGNLLNTQYQQQMQQYNANQASNGSLMSGLGSLAGMGLFMMSSKDAKENKRPARGVLEAVEKMPVEQWKYKDGMGDEGEHIGPYAEDFKAATGRGDGKTIPVIDAVGVTMGAVQELSEKVDKLADKVEPKSNSGRRSRSVLEHAG